MLTILELKEKVDHLNYKLECITKFVCLLNSKTENLGEILGLGKSSKYMKGIGYIGESSNSKNMFVTPIQKIEFKMSGYKLQQLSQHLDQHSNFHTIVSWVCHYFGRRGHIRPYCYKLHGRSS